MKSRGVRNGTGVEAVIMDTMTYRWDLAFSFLSSFLSILSYFSFPSCPAFPFHPVLLSLPPHLS